jgi:Asp-tRNA(Asn)/Glu-tRNA(Gln) amidotransferase A subunit family amidase
MKQRGLSGIDRRSFLRLGAATGAGLLCSSWPHFSQATPQPQLLSLGDNAPWIDISIPQLQAMMFSGALSSLELTLGVSAPIFDLNPLSHAVIEINPEAVAIAARLDEERCPNSCLAPARETIKVLGRQATSEEIETVTWAYSEYARQFSASDYAEAITTVHRTGRVVGSFFTAYDILMTPTMCTPPHKLGEVSMMRTDIEEYRNIVGGDVGNEVISNFG